MSWYDSDKVDIKHYTINPETGNKILSLLETDVKCRVENNNSIVLSNTGKEEKAKYLVSIKLKNLKTLLRELDGIVVKTVMGQTINEKEFEAKEVFYAGSRKMSHVEAKLG